MIVESRNNTNERRESLRKHKQRILDQIKEIEMKLHALEAKLSGRKNPTSGEI